MGKRMENSFNTSLSMMFLCINLLLQISVYLGYIKTEKMYH